MALFANPFRPGAGHMPPYLAGREHEKTEFRALLAQDRILQNLVLTGLRGVGKTVLLDTLKTEAITADWMWVGTDLSESASISEARLVTRMIADLATVTSSIAIAEVERPEIGFLSPSRDVVTLGYRELTQVYEETPGLASDKLKAVLDAAWQVLGQIGRRGLIFAYDEAQNLSDHADKEEFPLSLLLDVFQSIQKKGIPFMLALAGLPTLFPKLVEARTFAERMFRVVFLDRLSPSDSREAILKPIQDAACPIRIGEACLDTIIQISGGYPYFLQFVCREVFDVFIRQRDHGERAVVPVADILRKLDADFFAGRWARASDRQRQLLTVVAHLPCSDDEFGIQEVVEKSRQLAGRSSVLAKPFSPSHVNQMFAKLAALGLLYKNRHGKYSFAVPFFGQFILRQIQQTPGRR